MLTLENQGKEYTSILCTIFENCKSKNYFIMINKILLKIKQKLYQRFIPGS